MTCPECGGEVEKVRAEEGGCIEETLMATNGGYRRGVRPATFYACTGCEWCSETKPPEPEEREKGDDDGREYGDPRDHRDGLE